MKMNTRHLPAILAVLAMLLLSSLACSFSSDAFQKGSADIDIALKESDINTLLQNSRNDIHDEDALLKRITQVELHDGFVRVFGDYDRPDGSTASGSYDATFRAEDGALKAEIIAVDLENISLSDERVQRINQELAESLERSARESKGEVEFKTVDVTEDAMSMKVKVYWNADK
jgi:hypothetical protein